MWLVYNLETLSSHKHGTEEVGISSQFFKLSKCNTSKFFSCCKEILEVSVCKDNLWTVRDVRRCSSPFCTHAPIKNHDVSAAVSIMELGVDELRGEFFIYLIIN